MAARDSLNTLCTLAVQERKIWLAGNWDGLADIATALSFAQVIVNFALSWQTVLALLVLYAGSQLGTRIGFIVESLIDGKT